MLKCREELIAEKVARERDSELLELIRLQTVSDDRSQQQLKTEISRLQEQLGECCQSLIAL